MDGIACCPTCGFTTSCHCNDPEKIIHAAVKSVDGRIFFGKCHGDCFFKAHAMSVKMSSKADHQGFLTNKGRFVNRKEAAEIASFQGQVDTPTTILFSEDLWSERDGGKYNHDEIKGYVLKNNVAVADWSGAGL